MADEELIIRITQYICADKNDPEKPSISLSIDCYFDGKKIPIGWRAPNPTLNDLYSKLKKYSEILSLNSTECVFHVPIRFQGVCNKNAKSESLPDNSRELGSKHSLLIGNESQSATIFEKGVVFEGEFSAPMCFKDVDFEGKVESSARWEDGVEFKDCHFKGDVDFRNSAIGTTAIQTLNAFDHCTFHEKADFSNSTFGVKTYFHRSTFKDEALFYRSKFSDVANFYFTTFHKAPNFSMCVFNNSKLANFIGVDTSRFNMENVEKYVIEKAKSETEGEEGKINSLRGRGIEYLKIQHALNTRDSFRTIKETLNAQANVLESQKWHKLELYAKELELGYRKGFEKLEEEAQRFGEELKQRKIQQNNSVELLEINKKEKLKNTIEYYQLCFYRSTSDHHTDLMRIISYVIITIGVFGLIFFGIEYLQKLSWLNTLYVMFMFLLFCVKKCFKNFFNFARVVGLISSFWVVCHKPSLIFGAVNLVDKAPRSVLENIVLVLYTLMMILLLFSLQKTARKNSIIPN